VLLYSVIVFIVIPLIAGTLLRIWFVRARGQEWFEKTLLPRFAPLTIAALLATLVLIFAFQADNITGRFLHVLVIAVPITLQVYFKASLTYGLMKLLKVEHSIAAPGALIRASNFFELAVATAIALFGPDEPAGGCANTTGNGCTEHDFHRNWVSGPISVVGAKQVVNPAGENWVNSLVIANRPPKPRAIVNAR